MKNEEQYLAVIKVLELIEKYISEKKKAGFIKEEIYKECGYERKYFNTIFKKYVKCSVAKYIKIMDMLATYRVWLKEKEKVAQRDTFNSFEYFSLYFKREFGEDLETADENSVLSKARMTKDELVNLKVGLDNYELVNEYEFIEEGLEINYNSEKVLEYALMRKNYFILKEIRDRVDWDNLSLDEKKMLLIMLSRDEGSDITYDEFYAEMRYLEKYNLDNPYVYDDYYVFSGELPWSLLGFFRKVVLSCQDRIVISYPDGLSVPEEYDVYKRFFNEEFDSRFSFIPLMRKTRKDIQDMLPTWWEMAEKGFFRLREK